MSSLPPDGRSPEESTFPRDLPPVAHAPGSPPGAWPGYPSYPAPPPLIDPDRPFPGFGMAILLCILFLFCTQIPAALVAVAVLFFFVLKDPAKFQEINDPLAILRTTEGSLAMGGAMFLAQVNVIVFSLLMLRWLFGRDWARRVALRWPGWGVCLIALASTPGFVFLGNLVYSWLRQMLPLGRDANVPGVEIMGELVKTWPVAFGILVIGFGPGIGEELWCRGFLGRGLVGRYGTWVGVLMTSFLFGAIHVDPCQGIMALLMGMWLHYVYLTTRSLWMPMVLHTVNNTLAVLGSQVESLEQLDEVTTQLPQMAGTDLLFPLGAALFLFAVVAWALYQTRGRLVKQPGVVTWEPPFPSVDCPPGDSQVAVEPGQLTLGGACLVLLAFAISVGSLIRLMSIR